MYDGRGREEQSLAGNRELGVDQGRRTSPLAVEPKIEVHSIDELMALAIAMEQEAGRRYRQMAERMRLQGVKDLSDLFTFLADVEDKHAAQIGERAKSIVGRLPDSSPVRWELPEGFHEEEGRSYLLTPYSALAIAVRNEDRAFAFYAYLAAHTEDPMIRKAAEDLAKDELEHAALLRRERRKAWRTHPPPELLETSELTSFLARVAVMEGSSAAAHRRLSALLAGQGRSFEAKVFEEAARSEELCASDAIARGALRPIATFDSSPSETIRDGLRLLDYAFDQYAETAERAQDEAVLAAAQDFERHALRRLSYAQGALAESGAMKTDQGEE